jgi:hypothetical protein
MTRTQILLPDELYRRAKRFSEARELSLAEITRRGIELFLARYPEPGQVRSSWTLPRFDGGGLRIPLDRLRDVAADEETRRGISGR